MSPPAIAAFYAGLNALILIWLAIEVINQRRRSGVGLGDGGDEALNRAIRGHGNAVETIPIALILLVLTEMLGAPALALHILGIALTGGRLLHGLHFTGRAPAAFRGAGMGATLLTMIILAIGLLILAAGRIF
ncbi:MAPEG family protein [Pikeienuella sp. HZG-20]|uniref:MAPEG family protein n=1 Tax=Paludibacillus litoralis TaxID=3133267 RepID=UPI0030EF7C7C